MLETETSHTMDDMKILTEWREMKTEGEERDRIKRVIRILPQLAALVNPQDCSVFLLVATANLPNMQFSWSDAVLWVKENQTDYDWEFLSWGVSHCYRGRWNPLIKRRIRTILEILDSTTT